MPIPAEYYRTYICNCLNAEQFAKFAAEHEIGEEFECACQDCGKFTIGDMNEHRCHCGNRRCYFTISKYNGKEYLECACD
jgi:hypothetical protein